MANNCFGLWLLLNPVCHVIKNLGHYVWTLPWVMKLFASTHFQSWIVVPDRLAWLELPDICSSVVIISFPALVGFLEMYPGSLVGLLQFVLDTLHIFTDVFVPVFLWPWDNCLQREFHFTAQHHLIWADSSACMHWRLVRKHYIGKMFIPSIGFLFCVHTQHTFQSAVESLNHSVTLWPSARCTCFVDFQ